MMTSTEACMIEVALDCHCDLGEGPIFDSRTSTLYFVDINRNTIHAFNTDTSDHESMQLDEPVGAVALVSSNASYILACTRRRILLIDFSNKSIIRTVAETPESHGTDDALRFNDAKVSPGGAFVLGRMHTNWRQAGLEFRGRLYSLDPGATELREIFPPESVGLPNGMAWSADGKSFYFVDSSEESITVYPTDHVGAPILTSENSRTIRKHPTGHKNVPDGMTIDNTGNLWVAVGESGCIVQFSAHTGEELQRVQLPVHRPTSCNFGGRGLEWLYVTTRVETGEGASPHHGGLLRLKLPGGLTGLHPDDMYNI